VADACVTWRTTMDVAARLPAHFPAGRAEDKRKERTLHDRCDYRAYSARPKCDQGAWAAWRDGRGDDWPAPLSALPPRACKTGSATEPPGLGSLTSIFDAESSPEFCRSE